MKRFLYCFMALFISSAMIVSCGDDDDATEITFNDNAAQAAAGEYNGTFTRVTKGSTDSVSASGIIRLVATETPGIATMEVECEDFSTSCKVNVNVTHSNMGFMFNNPSLVNEIESPVVGKIDASSKLQTSFVLKQRSGRKTVQYDYSFVGMK